MARENATHAEEFATLDKKFAASPDALIVLCTRVNVSLRRESVFFIAL